MDWNVIVTVRHDFGRAVQLLRKLGHIERTGLFNVIVMRVIDVHALLEQIEQSADPRFFDTISHIVPVTHKLRFTTAEDLEHKALEVALGWQAQLAGRSVHVRMRRRGHKGEIHGAEVEHHLGKALLDELARRGTPGLFAHDDPDLVLAIETIRDEAGLALWTRAELDRYPFLRASIERGASRRSPGAPRESAPSRELLASATEIAARSQTAHPASASEIVDLLGELEPLTLEKLVATGATIGEVAEAVSAIEDEDAFGEMHHAPSTPREAEVRAILEDLVFEDFEDRESEIART
jgi:tRNA(Ser,Leu) C12 N-acetylase TAN1